MDGWPIWRGLVEVMAPVIGRVISGRRVWSPDTILGVCGGGDLAAVVWLVPDVESVLVGSGSRVGRAPESSRLS